MNLSLLFMRACTERMYFASGRKLDKQCRPKPSNGADCAVETILRKSSSPNLRTQNCFFALADGRVSLQCASIAVLGNAVLGNTQTQKTQRTETMDQ